MCNETTRTIELVVEVDPNPNPKKLMGDILAVLLADNYTPSNGFSPYKFEKALFVFLTVLDGRSGSQKASQFKRIEEALREKLDLESLGIRDVRLCFGKDEEDAVNQAQAVVRDFFTAVGEHSVTSATAHASQSTKVPKPTVVQTSRHGYSLNPNFDTQELRRLLQDFRNLVKRERDVSLARNLELELLEQVTPTISRSTLMQLAKWCKTGGIYSEGMDVARRMSQLLFGSILDRDALGV